VDSFMLRTADVFAKYRIDEIASSTVGRKIFFGAKDEEDVVVQLVEGGGVEQLFRQYEVLKSLTKVQSVPEVLEMVCESKKSFLVTEFISQTPLATYVKSNQENLNEENLSLIVKSILDLLQICHEENIVHLNIGLDSIIVTEKDVTLGSWHYSRKLGDKSLQSIVIGNPWFLSPELARSSLHVEAEAGVQEITPEVLKAHDMWSLGIVLYVIVTGTLPFREYTNQARFEKISKHHKVVFPKSMKGKGNKPSPELLDFITCLLSSNMHDRMTVFKALEHDFIKNPNKSENNLKIEGKEIQQLAYAIQLSKGIDLKMNQHSFKLWLDQIREISEENLELILETIGFCSFQAERLVSSLDFELTRENLISKEELFHITPREALVNLLFKVTNAEDGVDCDEFMGMMQGYSKNFKRLVKSARKESDSKLTYDKLLSRFKFVGELVNESLLSIPDIMITTLNMEEKTTMLEEDIYFAMTESKI